MADNVDITEGSGVTIHADEYTHGTLGSGKTQLMKLVDGVLDSDTPITVDVGAKANALRVAPANDITDATYIGDIKFGESLPAGTNEIGKLAAGTAAIGKLAANSGVDIGDVTLTAGTAAIGKLAANSGVDIGDVDVLSLPASTNTIEVVGDAANNAAAAGNPVAIGVLYDSTKPTGLDDGDVGYALGDSYGRILSGLEPEWFNSVYDSSDATAEAEVVKAATVGKKIYIMSYVISVDIEGWIKLQDEDSNALTGKFWLKAGGGVAITLPPGAPLILNVANKALEVIAEAAGDISVTITGYLAP